MFEARLTQGKVFKQLIEALKDLVQEANIDCTDDDTNSNCDDWAHNRSLLPFTSTAQKRFMPNIQVTRGV